MERKDPITISGAILSLHKTLREEIQKEQERDRSLYAAGTSGRVTLIILGAAILANIIVFLKDPLFPLLFISASFFLFMIYFITLLIPHNLRHPSLPQTEISRYLTGLRVTGITTSTKRFTGSFLMLFLSTAALSFTDLPLSFP